MTNHENESLKLLGQRSTIIIGDQPTSANFMRSYAPNLWDEFPDRVIEPLIGIHDVLDTQSLVMKLKDQHGRSILRGERRHGFAALNAIHTNPDAVYDDSLEEYLVARVAKESYDQWSMRIRFRQNKLSEESQRKSNFDDYAFSWLRNGNVQAWYGGYSLEATDDGTIEQWHRTEPLSLSMLEDLHQRLGEHMTMVVATDALRNLRRQSIAFP